MKAEFEQQCGEVFKGFNQFYLAECSLEEGKYSNAIAEFQSALSIEPSLAAGCYYNIARAYAHIPNGTQDALSALGDAVKHGYNGFAECEKCDDFASLRFSGSPFEKMTGQMRHIHTWCSHDTTSKKWVLYPQKVNAELSEAYGKHQRNCSTSVRIGQTDIPIVVEFNYCVSPIQKEADGSTRKVWCFRNDSPPDFLCWERCVSGSKWTPFSIKQCHALNGAKKSNNSSCAVTDAVGGTVDFVKMQHNSGNTAVPVRSTRWELDAGHGNFRPYSLMSSLALSNAKLHDVTECMVLHHLPESADIFEYTVTLKPEGNMKQKNMSTGAERAVKQTVVDGPSAP
jgi:hypothetical protein